MVNWIVVTMVIWSMAMVFLVLGFPSILENLVRYIFPHRFVRVILLQRNGEVYRGYARYNKDMIFRKFGHLYQVDPVHLRGKTGLWQEGILQQLPWPQEDRWENKLRSTEFEAVYHSKVAEWLNLLTKGTPLQTMMILLLVLLLAVGATAYLAYQNYHALQVLGNTMVRTAQNAGIQVVK